MSNKAGYVEQCNMELTLKSHKRRVKKKINKDHYWYDSYSNKLLHGKGGKIIFVYDKQKGHSVPRIVDDESWIYEDSYDDICKWVQDNLNKLNFTVINVVPRKCINISLRHENLDAILDDLYRHKIISDYSELEYKREKRGTKSRRS